jgi:hypothetical protein
MKKSKQYDISVTIRVSVPTESDITPDEWAELIAKDYSRMALQYKSIGADDVLRVDIQPTIVSPEEAD